MFIVELTRKYGQVFEIQTCNFHLFWCLSGVNCQVGWRKDTKAFMNRLWKMTR